MLVIVCESLHLRFGFGKEAGGRKGLSMNTTKVVHVQRTINRQLAPSYSCKDMKLPVWATEIGPEAFSENRKIETIYFPHSLKYIRHHAFRHCLHLKRIILPDGLLELGEGAFAECSDLFAAVLPASLRVLPRALFVGDMAPEKRNLCRKQQSGTDRTARLPQMQAPLLHHASGYAGRNRRPCLL